MRVASSQLYGATIRSMLEQQSQLAKTQEQLATGNRVSNPADDPIGAVRIQGLERSLERTAQYANNSVILDSRLRLEEETVGNSIEILQRVRDMAIQANNPVHTEESKGALLVQLKQEINSLLSYANTQDNDGRYIFSGYQNAAPFSYGEIGGAAGRGRGLGEGGMTEVAGAVKKKKQEGAGAGKGGEKR